MLASHVVIIPFGETHVSQDSSKELTLTNAQAAALVRAKSPRLKMLFTDSGETFSELLAALNGGGIRPDLDLLQRLPRSTTVLRKLLGL